VRAHRSGGLLALHSLGGSRPDAAKDKPPELDGAKTRHEIQRALLGALVKHSRFSPDRLSMMAFDRTPAPRLEADTLEALRTVMQRAVRQGDHAQELQDVLIRAAPKRATRTCTPSNYS